MIDKIILGLEIAGGLVCCWLVSNTYSTFTASVYTGLSWVIGFLAGYDIVQIIENNRKDN